MKTTEAERIKMRFGPVNPPAWFSEFNASAPGLLGYDWNIQTPLGVLSVTFYRDWIACRFENIKAALTVVDCNEFSGKWNFHGEDREQTMRHWLGIIMRTK